MHFSYRHWDKIEAKSTELLVQFGIQEAPVPIKEIVKGLGVNLISYNLGDDGEVSGILVIDNNKGTIGYNPSNSRVRQRFTIAHELGHYLFHKDAKSDLFVDKDFLVKYRSEKKYTAQELRQEQEANSFAASILMPKSFLLAELAMKDYQDLSEVDFISAMAKVFDVSIPAMTYRIANANLFF